MEEFYLSLIQHLAEAILLPLGIWLLTKIFLFQEIELQKEFDYTEMEKLSNKRTLGCFANFFLLAILLTALHHSFWLPLYEWVNKVDNIIIMYKPTIVRSGVLAFYYAFPLSIFVTKHRFTQKYGAEKVSQLNNYHSILQNINNFKAEKWLFNSTLGLSIFLMLYFFNDIAIVTDKSVHYTNSFSIVPTIQTIEDISHIDIYEGKIAPNGSTNYHITYKIHFKQGDCWEITEKEKYNIALFLAQKKGLTIENKGIEP